MTGQRGRGFGVLCVLVLLLTSSCDAPSRSELPNTLPERSTASNGMEVPESVKRYVAANAIPLETVEADGALTDLLPLREMIGDARVVALGEATHGTHEFFTVKHRLVRFLVTQLGFTDFALETSLTDAAEIDKYVRRGTGDAGRALDMGFAVWKHAPRRRFRCSSWGRRSAGVDARVTRSSVNSALAMGSAGRRSCVLKPIATI